MNWSHSAGKKALELHTLPSGDHAGLYGLQEAVVGVKLAKEAFFVSLTLKLATSKVSQETFLSQLTISEVGSVKALAAKFDKRSYI